MRAHPAGPRHAELLADHGVGAPPADWGGLDPAIWPSGVARDSSSAALTLHGVDVRALAGEHGTPAMLLDEADVRGRARAYAEAFAGADVYYAAKAFLSTAVARWLVEEGLGIDVCTGGELAVALRAGVPGERLLLHGNNKSSAELAAALDAGVRTVVVDSFVEIERLAALAAQRGVRQRVYLRATVGVEAHTHEFIATAHEDQKFGLSVSSGAAEEAVRRIAKLPSLDFMGLHSHIGSQIFDAAGFQVAAARVVSLAQRIWDEQGIEIEELNLGGGMGIAYLESDDPLDVIDMSFQIGDIVGKECAAAGIPMPALAFEPGRAIVGPAAVTLYEVGTVKPVELDRGASRSYVSVDGGMSDNIRTALYDAEYSVVLASRESTAEPVLSRVVGKHCESGDIVVRDAWLPADLAPGDLLAVAATGAYCRSMASNYNLVPRPPVVAVRDGAATVIVRRETEDDLLALDVG
jgi:diaminopimelate decarboxylase